MGKILIALFSLLPLSGSVSAQEYSRLSLEQPDTLSVTEPFVLPDTVVHMIPWMPSYEVMAPVGGKPAISMTSLVLLPKVTLPRRVRVFEGSPRRLSRRLTVSNGQAWNWGPYPDAYLDARTLSFPQGR